jgi:phage-related protein
VSNPEIHGAATPAAAFQRPANLYGVLSVYFLGFTRIFVLNKNLILSKARCILMYRVFFYRDKNGRTPVAEYIRELKSRKDRSSRIKADKIREYVKALKKMGKGAGAPYIKSLQGEIWELRPLKDRILFAALDGGNFILLHRFVKKTRRTPQNEIDRAERYLTDYRERTAQNG